jgi:S-DNA-T family DNA segregation ATPase FtsK/SpoIIIE
MRALRTPQFLESDLMSELRVWAKRRAGELTGLALLSLVVLLAIAFATWSVDDPSLSFATERKARNALGFPGAVVADFALQLLGVATLALCAPVIAWGWRLLSGRGIAGMKLRSATWLIATILIAGAVASLPIIATWPLPTGMGGIVGDGVRNLLAAPLATRLGFLFDPLAFVLFGALGAVVLVHATGLLTPRVERPDLDDGEVPEAGFTPFGAAAHWFYTARGAVLRLKDRAVERGLFPRKPAEPEPDLPRGPRVEPRLAGAPAPQPQQTTFEAPEAPRAEQRTTIHRPVAHVEEPPFELAPQRPATQLADPDMLDLTAYKRVEGQKVALKPGKREKSEAQPSFLPQDIYELPPLGLLAEPKRNLSALPSEEALEQNARMLESVLDDFGVRGDIIHVRPGPVVTLYELQPAPGIKSSRVIGLADDIARSMSAISARVAVISGRNAIGIELPNAKRETVYLRELLASKDFEDAKGKLLLGLGKTIGGEPVIADLARMPHLLIAGTTGSGKSVGINTMILSLLYRLKPEQCRLIMIDPKMLELSVYDGIPHLLSPVVTDPKKAVIALKWTVREMEERYRKMSKLGVRNIDGYNQRIAQAAERGEPLMRTVQTGFDKETGEALFEQERMGYDPIPYIVVVVDEMADLMMVAGKDIEGAVQRLAQMARAAGIHIVMATQRPSVDVITGTIKANFPTRISFQVTSKIDSRTILGEMGAEQLLGQGDMLFMAGGGRISRVHGPFVSDEEVERIVQHLKSQGAPDYLDAVTKEDESEASLEGEDDGGAVFDRGEFGSEEGGDLYDQAVAIVLRDKKASTSYVQRRLQIGYNRAASLIERMEKEGVVSPANHAGKREILLETGRDA